MSGGRAGSHVKEVDARICWDTCDIPDDCICDGMPDHHQMRCVLERYLVAKRNGNDKPGKYEIPDGYLTIREVAWHKRQPVENIRRRINRGEFPGAKRLNGGKTAPWLIPEECL